MTRYLSNRFMGLHNGLMPADHLTSLAPLVVIQAQPHLGEK